MASSSNLGQDTIIGNPTELSISNLAYKKIENLDKELCKYKKIHEIPFDSTRKLMTVVYKTNNGCLSVTKGAIDRLPIEKSEELNAKINEVHDSFAERALRVIGVGFKHFKELPKELTDGYLENGLTFYGLVGIIDPPREESKQAVQVAKEAGIKTIMITGDHLSTAKAIAKEIGILYDDKKVIMTFIVMRVTTIVYMYNCRSHLSIFKIGFTSNKLLLGTTVMGTVVLALIVTIPQVANIFNLVHLGLWHWVIVIILSITPLVFIETQKSIGKFGRI